MNTLVAVLVLGVAIAVIGRVASWRRDNHTADMGTVSHQWLAEHRLGSGQDFRR
jgi:hypothetical protein